MNTPPPPPAPAPEAIRARGLKVVFRQGRMRIHALDGVDFSIGEGEIFGLLGPNGAGKSTAMYCLLGFLRPTAGEVRVLGAEPTPGARLFDDIAYLPEEPHYHPYLSVEEAVTYYAHLYRRRITDAEVTAALTAVALNDYRRLRIAKCSKGMKQKVGLAACMLFRPRLLFLDEPTRGLDPVSVRQLRDHLMVINRQGSTVVLNSHILSEVEMICSRVAILNRGRVLVDDRLGNLIRTSGEEYEVLTSPAPALPPYVRDVRGTPAGTSGVIARDELESLVRYCREQQLVLRSCRLRTETLEDVFMRVVGGAPS